MNAWLNKWWWVFVLLWLVILTLAVRVNHDLAKEDSAALYSDLRIVKTELTKQAACIKAFQAETNDAIASINARSGEWENEGVAKSEGKSAKIVKSKKSKKLCPKLKQKE